MFSVKGMPSFLTKSMRVINTIISIVKYAIKQYSYKEISIPVIGNFDIVKKEIGITSDIVKKQIYSLQKSNKMSLLLRPEFTSFIMHIVKLYRINYIFPAKFFTHGCIFRKENVQKNRLRQFNQFNCEHFNITSIGNIIENILLLNRICSYLYIVHQTSLLINYIGNIKTRSIYSELLAKYFITQKSILINYKYQKIQNPLSFLDNFCFNDRQILDLPDIKEFISQKELRKFKIIKFLLKNFKIDFLISKNLIRGMDYYEGLVFEVKLKKYALMGGGEYKYNSNGINIPCMGFAGGIERITNVILENIKLVNDKIFYIVPIGIKSEIFGIVFCQCLRNMGCANVEFDYNLSLKKRLYRAFKLNINYIIFFGNKEIKNHELIVKDLNHGIERNISMTYVIKYLDSI